jgi:hypothetical protein
LVLLLFLVSSIATADGTFVWRNQDADIHEPGSDTAVRSRPEDLVLGCYDGAASSGLAGSSRCPGARGCADDPQLSS